MSTRGRRDPPRGLGEVTGLGAETPRTGRADWSGSRTRSARFACRPRRAPPRAAAVERGHRDRLAVAAGAGGRGLDTAERIRMMRVGVEPGTVGAHPADPADRRDAAGRRRAEPSRPRRPYPGSRDGSPSTPGSAASSRRCSASSAAASGAGSARSRSATSSRRVALRRGDGEVCEGRRPSSVPSSANGRRSPSAACRRA